MARRSDFDEEDLRAFFEGALTLQPSKLVFNMDSKEERVELAKAMWEKHPLVGEDSMSEANSELASVLGVLLRNTYGGSAGDSAIRRTNFRIESILTNLQRAQSQKKMPLLTARFSCACLRAQLPRTLWEILSLCFPGLLASETWTQEFVPFASKHRPACNYADAELHGVGGVLFDNYTRKVLYSSQVTVEAHGFLLNMTNWATLRIPAALAPPNFDANELCACAAAVSNPAISHALSQRC